MKIMLDNMSEAQRDAIAERTAEERANFEKNKDADSMDGVYSRLKLETLDNKLQIPRWFEAELKRDSCPTHMVKALGAHFGVEIGQIMISLGTLGMPKQLQIVMAGLIMQEALSVSASITTGKAKVETVGIKEDGSVVYATCEGLAKGST